jgi:hypothetical protein
MSQITKRKEDHPRQLGTAYAKAQWLEGPREPGTRCGCLLLSRQGQIKTDLLTLPRNLIFILTTQGNQGRILSTEGVPWLEKDRT